MGGGRNKGGAGFKRPGLLRARMADKTSSGLFRKEPMDEAGSRTMFLGLLVSFFLYGLSFIAPIVWKDDRARWLSIALIAVSVVFLGVWFLMVRGGFRIGGKKTRSTRRAKMHAEHEREKRIRLR